MATYDGEQNGQQGGQQRLNMHDLIMDAPLTIGDAANSDIAKALWKDLEEPVGTTRRENAERFAKEVAGWPDTARPENLHKHQLANASQLASLQEEYENLHRMILAERNNIKRWAMVDAQNAVAEDILKLGGTPTL